MAAFPALLLAFHSIHVLHPVLHQWAFPLHSWPYSHYTTFTSFKWCLQVERFSSVIFCFAVKTSKSNWNFTVGAWELTFFYYIHWQKFATQQPMVNSEVCSSRFKNSIAKSINICGTSQQIFILDMMSRFEWCSNTVCQTMSPQWRSASTESSTVCTIFSIWPNVGLNYTKL